MRIAVVGTGYVGLVSGTCLAETGVTVTCVDVNNAKIELLNNGGMPIYEPGLAELVTRNREDGRLFFTTSLKEALKDADAVFIAVGTPPDEDGSADLHYVLDVAREIGEIINDYIVVVTKSTVPVGTNYKVKGVIQAALGKRGVDVVFDVVEEKTLPVTATTNYLRIADGYILYSTEVSKETVTLSGPSSELSKVATCTAEASYDSELTESVTLNTPLRFYTSGGKEVKFQYTTLEESNVDVTLQVYKTATLPVKVNFINAPRGFDNSVLSYALSCKQLKVAGPAEKIDALSTLSIGTIDLSTFSLNKVYEMPIELPTDIYLLDNISTITVSFDCSGLETKTMNLPSSCVQVVNLPATYQLTVETERLMNVILCGPKGAMETLTPEQVVIEIDAEDFAVATGQQNIACRLYVPSNGKIFALGSYVLQCRIESN